MVLLLLSQAPCSQLVDAGPNTATLLDRVIFSIQPKTVGSSERLVGARSGGATEVVLVKGDRQGGVGREDELGVALSPVPRVSIILIDGWPASPALLCPSNGPSFPSQYSARVKKTRRTHLMTAMFTGAEAVAS